MNEKERAFTPILDGLALPQTQYGRTGFVEAAMNRAIDAMQKTGDVDDRHAGSLALALVAARQVDEMGSHGRPSGRAMMLQAVVRVLELLPDPETANEGELSRLVAELERLAAEQNPAAGEVEV